MAMGYAIRRIINTFQPPPSRWTNMPNFLIDAGASNMTSIMMLDAAG